MDEGLRAGFSAGVADGAIAPVDVVRFKIGNICLGTTEVPAQIVKVAPFQVVLALENKFMLLDDDGAFGLELDGLLDQQIHIVAACEQLHLEMLRLLAHHFKGLCAYGAGGTEDGDALGHVLM